MIVRNLICVGLMVVLAVLALALGVTMVVDKKLESGDGSHPYSSKAMNTKSFDFANATESGPQGKVKPDERPSDGKTVAVSANATLETPHEKKAMSNGAALVPKETSGGVTKTEAKEKEAAKKEEPATKDKAKDEAKIESKDEDKKTPKPANAETEGQETEGGGGGGADEKDPEKVKFSLHALAIGDWGVSPAGDSCCAKYKKQGEDLYRDQQAQRNVAHLLSLSAKALKPKVVLSHGDNFYWNGLGTADAQYRIENTFEDMYRHKSLEGVKWLNVMGNHDYGGSAYLCGDSDTTWRACETEDEMIAALEARFTAQSEYKSPNADRWQLPSHYYKETIEDKAAGVTVDVFNVDTNAATVHGAEQVCCQCYGYQAGKKKSDPGYIECNTVHRGHDMCFGGDNELFDACVAKFKAWTDDSLKQLQRDTQASKADWKVVNSHYSPHYHMDPNMMKTWFTALEKGGVQLFINGHTHAESHDVSKFNTHFITNGAGGGIQSESIGKPPPYVDNVEMVWSGASSPYGFFELSFAKQWMRTRFVTFDKTWKFSEKPKETVKGSGEIQHCWYIPKDGSKGQECAKA